MNSNPELFRLMKNIKENIDKIGNNTLKNTGITLPQGPVLIYLSDREDNQSTLKEIERILNVAQPTAVGIVSRLEKNGYLTTYPSIQDKRVKMVKLTKLGLDSVSMLKESMYKTEEAILSPLTDIERTLLNQLLEKINSNLE